MFAGGREADERTRPVADAVRPTRGQVLATEPLPELLYERPHYARNGYDYWHQLPDRRLVIGVVNHAGVVLLFLLILLVQGGIFLR